MIPLGLQTCSLNLNRGSKELQPHGTVEFPCAGFSSQYTDRADDAIPWHWHEELEILYLKEGSLKLQIPEKTIPLTQGEGFVINSNILHYAAADPYCKLHSIVFHPSLIMGNADSVFAEKYILPLIGCGRFDGCRLPLKDEFTAAFDALASDAFGYEFTVREALSRICLNLYQSYAPDLDGYVRPDMDSARIHKMLDFIHEHFMEDLDLTLIAKAAHIGERECLRCFSRVIQVSPMQYLIKYRVTQAASLLLRNPDKSIAEISIQCGFESPSNFSQMFKRYYRCTPREYRKSNPANKSK